MLHRVRAAIARYGMFAPGQRVGVAVSGGADSVCLLYVLRELAADWALNLSVLHLNHCLRAEEARADEDFVRQMAAGLGLDFHSRSVDVRAVAAESGDNLEQAARRVRRDFFSGFLTRREVDRVALGHTLSDQAETVLFRVLRGASGTGLAAIRPVTPEGLVRPLIEVDRAAVLEYLTARGLAWREDSSNQDLSFARNRIRHALLPALTREWNPELPRTLARMARVAFFEEQYWEGEVRRIVEPNVIRRPPALLFRAGWVSSLKPAVARRVVRWVLQEAKGDLRGLDQGHIERILDLAASPEGSGRLQVSGLDVFRSFEWMRVAPPGEPEPAGRHWECRATVPGTAPMPDGTTRLSLELVDFEKLMIDEAREGQPRYNGGVGSNLDWGRIAGELCIRSWRPGDQYRPVGHACEIKVKALFQDARIPLWERRTWPVVTCGNQIVWVARFGPAAEYAASSRTRTVLRLRTIALPTEF